MDSYLDWVLGVTADATLVRNACSGPFSSAEALLGDFFDVAKGVRRIEQTMQAAILELKGWVVRLDSCPTIDLQTCPNAVSLQVSLQGRAADVRKSTDRSGRGGGVACRGCGRG
jgi:hypothetical protein